MIIARARLRIYCLAAVLMATGSVARSATLEEVRLLSSDEAGLEAEVTLPLPEVLPAAGRSGYQIVRLGNIPTTGRPGEPALPSLSFWIALPPGASPIVSGTPLEEALWNDVRPVPVSRPEWIEGPAGSEPVYQETIAEDRAIYGGGLFPANTAAAGQECTLRHLRIAPIVVRPARWDPATGDLRIARRVRVKVVFAQWAGAGIGPSGA